MKTGFPLHFTVKVVPSAIAPTSNSADARARTSADGLMLETNLRKSDADKIKMAIRMRWLCDGAWQRFRRNATKTTLKF